MKNRIGRFLLDASYLILLLLLLYLQMQKMSGEISRYTSMLLTLLLTIPAFLILQLYLVNQEKSAKEKQNQESLKDILSRASTIFEAAGLTRREQEVALLILRGYSNVQIAEELYISETTVKKHATHIYEKLGVSGRKELREKVKKAEDTNT